MSVKDQVKSTTNSSEARPTSVQGSVVGAPATEFAPVLVVIDAWDPTHAFECHWMDRAGSYPEVGDIASVEQDADGEYWVKAWYAPTRATLISPSISQTMGVALHGSNANYLRPTGFTSVTWIGSVAPNNMIDGDIWINTAP